MLDSMERQIISYVEKKIIFARSFLPLSADQPPNLQRGIGDEKWKPTSKTLKNINTDKDGRSKPLSVWLSDVSAQPFPLENITTDSDNSTYLSSLITWLSYFNTFSTEHDRPLYSSALLMASENGAHVLCLTSLVFLPIITLLTPHGPQYRMKPSRDKVIGQNQRPSQNTRKL